MKPGYKQTEVGIIPKDWEVKVFGKLYAEPSRNGIYKSAEYQGRGTRIVNMGEMFGLDFISDQEMSRVSLTPKEIATTGLRDGDLLFGRRSVVPAGAGKCSLVVEPIEPLTFESSIIRVRLDQSGANPLFHYYFFASSTGRAVMSIIVSGTNVKGIRASELRELKIPHPPIPEQRAIATALSDVDALLGALDRLIAKKRDLKQAAMQQLLTGQTRLPGFRGEWEVKRLGDVGEISSAGVDKKIRPDEVPVRLVNYLDVYRKDFIYSDDLNHWVTAPPQQAQRCAVQKGDVFFTPTSETRDDIGISAVAMEDIPDAAYSYHVARLRLREPWDLCFRTYAFKTRAFLDQAETLCDGNGTRYVISQGKFRSMTVQVPPLPEQTAIAAVLTDMDAELALLEARLVKTRALKQGMMQELLTGKTRLVSLEVSHA